ncbi:hypothetical protein OIV83_001368 [Microbotryomycetes sp. JL201]|nr:hypothetical protein OIV83_001368 [Microbotryomycetes sp. JL201]
METESFHHPPGAANRAPSITGRCLCGAVEVQVSKPAVDAASFGTCYCINCRKASGSSYAHCFKIRRNDLTICSNENLAVKAYRDTDTAPNAKTGTKPVLVRSFCSVCGSSLWDQAEEDKSLTDPEAEVFLRATLFSKEDLPNEGKPSYELFCCRRESWLPGIHGAKQHDMMN